MTCTPEDEFREQGNRGASITLHKFPTTRHSLLIALGLGYMEAPGELGEPSKPT